MEAGSSAVSITATFTLSMSFFPSTEKNNQKSAESIVKDFKAVGKQPKCLNFKRLLKGLLKSVGEVSGASTAALGKHACRQGV